MNLGMFVYAHTHVLMCKLPQQTSRCVERDGVGEGGWEEKDPGVEKKIAGDHYGTSGFLLHKWAPGIELQNILSREGSQALLL